jgi:hypothetical protein
MYLSLLEAPLLYGLPRALPTGGFPGGGLPSPCATPQALAGRAELGMRQVLGAAGGLK